MARGTGARHSLVRKAGPKAAAVGRGGGGAPAQEAWVAHALGERTVSAGGRDGSGGGAVFADQFENLANYRAHLADCAEIWAQVPRCIKYL